MYPRDWRLFLLKGRGKEICFTQVDEEIRDHLGAEPRSVYMHHDYVVKAVLKHSITVNEFPHILETIDYGAAFADREAHVSFYRKCDGTLYQVTIKRAFEPRRIYISTFYQQNDKEVARKTRKAQLLRAEK